MAEPSVFTYQPETTVNEVKTWIRDSAKAKGGVVCPCCESKLKAKGKKPTPAQVALLTVLYNNYQVGQVLDMVAVAAATNHEELTESVAKSMVRLVHWDLIETTDNPTHFRLCEGGYYFVCQGHPITPRLWFLDDRVIAKDGKPAKLSKMLGTKFDLNELLQIRFAQS